MQTPLLSWRIGLSWPHAEEQYAFFVAGEQGIVRSRNVSSEELWTGGYFDEARAWLGVEPLQPDEEAP
jgi:hypothetical protein